MKINLGASDRIIRILVTLAIAGLYYANIINGTIAIALLLVAGIFIFTSLTSFCPIYALFGLSSCKKKAAYNMIQSNMSREKELDLKRLVAEGALLIDVRSAVEFSNGHLEASVNIPLDQLMNHLQALNKKETIITCCASGMRSETAKNILVANGFSEVYNGGSWSALTK